jgi:hypothetical protein
MGFTKERFPDCHHICLIFDDDEQRRQIVPAFLAAGLRDGELVRDFVDTTSPDTVRAWLSELGINPEAGPQLGIVKAEEAYCPNGHFDPQERISSMLARYDMAKKAGYTGSRVTGEMTWAFKGIPGSERLLEYEVLLNTVTDPFPHIGMCQYDARLFDGATLFRVLRVHPYMVAQGQVVRNPYYLRPPAALKELGIPLS